VAELFYRPIKDWPVGWPSDEWRHSPFKAGWGDTRVLLDREVEKLGADSATIQLDIRESAVRIDGGLKEGSKVAYRGAILVVESADYGTLSYPCDAFGTFRLGNESWRENVRAIALGLEALRKVERYGIANRGQQYAGYRELGSGIAMGPARMSEADALEVLRLGAGWKTGPDHDDRKAIRACYKLAAKRLHPDHGGDEAEFKRLQDAMMVLDADVD
jgi:hypothetical protein